MIWLRLLFAAAAVLGLAIAVAKGVARAAAAGPDGDDSESGLAESMARHPTARRTKLPAPRRGQAAQPRIFLPHQRAPKER
ncbi:hypothetical protein [Streptomyces anandii]|uniref:hypothetical protein n=1 Tax=Streptomyces anandii TaxID=285454 RepID=UPI0037A412AA